AATVDLQPDAKEVFDEVPEFWEPMITGALFELGMTTITLRDERDKTIRPLVANIPSTDSNWRQRFRVIAHAADVILFFTFGSTAITEELSYVAGMREKCLHMSNDFNLHRLLDTKDKRWPVFELAETVQYIFGQGSTQRYDITNIAHHACS